MIKSGIGNLLLYTRVSALLKSLEEELNFKKDMGVGVERVPTGASAVHGLALLISLMKRPFCTADLSIKLIEMHWGWITITMACS